MFEKAIALFVSGKLLNYMCFFGFMTLTLAAIGGMVWAYLRTGPKKDKREASNARNAKI